MSSLACPACGGLDVMTIDSRPKARATLVYRRMRCPGCGHRFSSHERALDLRAGLDASADLRELQETLAIAQAQLKRLMRDG